MQDEKEKSTDILIRTLGNILKRHRIAQRKTIYKISAEVSMSKATWREAEIGACKDIKLTTLWKIAEGLEIPLENIINEVKEELGAGFSLTEET